MLQIIITTMAMKAINQLAAQLSIADWDKFNPMAMIKGVYLYGELIVDWYSVVRWAYLKDLLPKGGEE